MSHPEVLPELIENGRQILASCARIQDTTGLADEFPFMVRSLGKTYEGAYKCVCGRYLKGFPDNGRRIEHVHVWEEGDESNLGTYRVIVDPKLHQA